MSIWVTISFLGLAVALQAVVHLAQQLRHLLMADRMLLTSEFCA
jgi:hypothetical protein